jgi:hypothetical protein
MLPQHALEYVCRAVQAGRKLAARIKFTSRSISTWNHPTVRFWPDQDAQDSARVLLSSRQVMIIFNPTHNYASSSVRARCS